MQPLYPALAVLAAFVFCNSCYKTAAIPADQAGSILYKTVSFGTGRYDSVDVTYYYDVFGRDSCEIGIAAGNISSYATYIFDSTGKVSAVTYKYNSASYNFNLIYDGIGRMVKKIANPVGSADNFTFAYDDAGNVIADTDYDAFSNQAILYNTYAYDNNSNLVTETLYEDQGSGFVFDYARHHVYDNRPNPYNTAALRPSVLASGYDFALLSKNNISGSQVAYTYNSHGLPIKYTLLTSSSYPVYDETDYYYK